MKWAKGRPGQSRRMPSAAESLSRRRCGVRPPRSVSWRPVAASVASCLVSQALTRRYWQLPLLEPLQAACIHVHRLSSW